MIDDDVNAAPPARAGRRGLKIALVGAGIAAGAITATAFGANAAQSATSGSGSTTGQAGTTSTTSTSTTTPDPDDPHGPFGRPGGSAPVRGDEKPVSTSRAATLKAAALKAVPGGTVYRVETDAGDGTYEAHMTKADGSLVTVKFAKNLTVTSVETGMGKGDPGHRH